MNKNTEDKELIFNPDELGEYIRFYANSDIEEGLFKGIYEKLEILKPATGKKFFVSSKSEGEIYIVLKGKVRVFNEQEEYSLSLTKGALFGGVSSYGDIELEPYTVRASFDAVVAKIEQEYFNKILSSHSNINVGVVNELLILSDRLKKRRLNIKKQNLASVFSTNIQVINNLLTKKDYYSERVEANVFSQYFEAGKVLGLTDKEANFFAATAADYSAQERMEAANIDNKSTGSLKRVIAKKLRIENTPAKELDEVIKRLADKLLDPENLEAARKVYQGDVNDRLEILGEFAENKQLADMVRANPELLQAYQQMRQNQND